MSLRRTGRSGVNRGVRDDWLDRGWSGRRPRVVGDRGTGHTDGRLSVRLSFRPRLRELEHAVSSALAATIVGGNRITRLENGAQFYPEMLAAISAAERSIALECYIFHPGRTGDAFTAALVERATAGAHVRIILDAFGSRRLHRRQVLRLARPYPAFQGERTLRRFE